MFLKFSTYYHHFSPSTAPKYPWADVPISGIHQMVIHKKRSEQLVGSAETSTLYGNHLMKTALICEIISLKGLQEQTQNSFFCKWLHKCKRYKRKVLWQIWHLLTVLNNIFWREFECRSSKIEMLFLLRMCVLKFCLAYWNYFSLFIYHCSFSGRAAGLWINNFFLYCTYVTKKKVFCTGDK